MDFSDSRLDRLLADTDHLSVTEKEQVLDRVLTQVAQERAAKRHPTWSLRLWAPATVALTLGTVLIVILAPHEHEDEHELTARGGPAAAPGFELSCVAANGQSEPCTRGDRLLFWISPGHFGAFAAVALGPDGKTFWYFPSDDRDVSVDLKGLKRSGLLDRIVTLDEDHVAGAYTVYGAFSGEPLSKERVRRSIEHTEESDVVVLRRELYVEERSP